MVNPEFHDEDSLIETAEKLGKKALKSHKISSFVVRHFADNSQFYIPNEQESDPLTPEQAYLKFKQMMG